MISGTASNVGESIGLPVKTGSIYPAPYDALVAGRSSLRLGDAGGLTQFGVNLVTLQPGALSGSLASADGEGDRAPGASIGPQSPAKQPVAKTRSLLRKKPVPRPTLASIPLSIPPESEGPLNLLAFIRWASVDHAAATAAIADAATRARWQWRAEEAAWAWAQLGRTAAWRLLPEAPAHYARAWTDLGMAAGAGELPRGAAAWSDETLAWMVRSAIRAATVVHALKRHNKKYGMLTMCVGMGQGAAGIFERV